MDRSLPDVIKWRSSKMKAIVIYNSKTGFSEKYGRWIAGELSCDAVSYKDMTPEKLAGIDTVIYGAGLMAGTVNGLKKLKELPMLKNKRLIVYATGAAAGAPELIQKMKNDNLTLEEQKTIPFFYFEGGINYENMGFMPRMMLRAIYRMLKGKKDRTAEETGMMLAIEKTNDRTKREYIKPLLDFLSNTAG